jgi:hypothetical protein
MQASEAMHTQPMESEGDNAMVQCLYVHASFDQDSIHTMSNANQTCLMGCNYSQVQLRANFNQCWSV